MWSVLDHTAVTNSSIHWHKPCCCRTHIPQHTFAVFEHFPGIGVCADVVAHVATQIDPPPPASELIPLLVTQPSLSWK